MWFKVLYYMITLVIFLFLDFAWIGMIAKKFYNKHLGFLMRKKPNWTAAIVVLSHLRTWYYGFCVNASDIARKCTVCTFIWRFVWPGCLCHL